MWNLITLGSNVCVRGGDASLKKLNYSYASTESLFNAVKKQHGNSHLLKLTLPSPPPAGVPSPALLPRLPGNPDTTGPDTPQMRIQAESFNIKMIETDLESTAKFVRELVVESLIPWMGKCILEWNEAVSDLFTPPWLQDLIERMFLCDLVFVVSKVTLPIILFHSTIVWHRVNFELTRPRHSSTTFSWAYDIDEFCGLFA